VKKSAFNGSKKVKSGTATVHAGFQGTLNTRWYLLSSPASPRRAAAPMQLAIVQWQAASAPKIAQESALHLHRLHSPIFILISAALAMF